MNDNVISALYNLYIADGALTTTQLAKRVFAPEGTSEVRNADRKIRNYFEGSYSHLVETVDGESPKRFRLADRQTWFGLGTINIVTPKTEELTRRLGRTMVYRDESGEPHVVNIEVESRGDGDDDGKFDGAVARESGL